MKDIHTAIIKLKVAADNLKWSAEANIVNREIAKVCENQIREALKIIEQ